MPTVRTLAEKAGTAADQFQAAAKLGRTSEEAAKLSGKAKTAGALAESTQFRFGRFDELLEDQADGGSVYPELIERLKAHKEKPKSLSELRLVRAELNLKG